MSKPLLEPPVSRKTLASLLLVILAACSTQTQNTWAGDAEDGLEVWFRDGDLDAVTNQHLATFNEELPGEADELLQAFPGAPPVIPHTVDGMLPILGDENSCMDCHSPENAEEEEAVPVPESHFEDAVMVKGDPGEAQVWKVKTYRKGDAMSGSR